MSKEKLYVIDGDQKVPFLRGMITHSLIEKGLSFTQAYEIASLVRDQIRAKKVVKKDELGQLIRQLVTIRFGEDYIKESLRFPGVTPTILVSGEDSDVPFSKGILSQSLQATGLDPSIAYDVAREIEASLLREERKEVGRDQLRRMIYETILNNHDARFAERYLLWRCFKTPDKPLVVLFGGATGTGKSSTATEVGHRIGMQRILSTDTVRQIMRMMISRDLLPAIHYSSYEAWKQYVSPEPESGTAVVEAFREQSIRVLVGVRAMIERAVQENFSILIEGVHLVPGLMELDQFEQQAYIVPLVISTLNRAAYLERFPIRQSQAGSRTAQRYRDNFDSILRIQDYILEMSELHDMPIIENTHFDETVLSALTVISNTLHEKLGVGGHDLMARVL